MKIPKKLKIGGHIYTVQIVKVTNEAKGSSNWGRSYHGTQKILIDKELSTSKQEETFIHELFHCAENLLSYNSKEPYVERMSNALYQIIKDNKLFK